VAALACLALTELSAQGRVIAPCPAPRPAPAERAVPCRPAVVRLASNTLVELDGRIARTTITETFENRGGPLGEADVFYPLPSGAAFEELRLEINGELVAGEVLDAASARETYERIVRAQRDPALVEWAGRGLLRARIFPFGAGERRTVVIRWRSLTPREGEALRVQASLAGADDPRDESATGSVRIRWRDDALAAPWSPTHTVTSRTRGDGQEAELTGRPGDVVAYLPLRSATDAIGVSVLGHVDARGERHALVLVSPPRTTGARVLPRDVTLAIDVSGSMSGEKLTQAIAAGHALLSTLGPQDRLRLLAFADDVECLHETPVPVTSASRREAARWLDGLQARGGTNIGGALATALAPARTATGRDRLPFVLLVTDGQPTVGLRAADILDSAAVWRGNARVFTFGVGADVDASLTEQLALEGRGTAHFVRPDESVERAVALVAARLASPLLADLQVTVAGGTLTQVYTPLGTDLMAGQELILLARYRGNDRTRLEVSGVREGRRETLGASLTIRPDDARTAFVPRLWAVQRVAALDAARRRHGPSAVLDDEIRALGDRYGVPTPFTSYLVLEPGPPAGPLPVRSAAPSGRGTRDRGPSAPTAPAAEAVAFEAARASAAQRQAVTLAQADALLAAEKRPDTRVIAGRVYVWRDDRWRDRRFDTEPAWQPAVTVRVRAYSEAWFALARALPALAEPFALGERLLVRGARVRIEITPEGRDTLDEATLRAVRSAW
jgi:Ca-activated chloride channel family protein